MSNVRMVLTTIGDPQAAEKLAEQLVERRVAACVNIVGPIRSIYRWKGKVERAQEFLLLIKTTAEEAARVPAVLEELHPYELPECVTLPVEGGSEPYLAWVASGVGQSD